MMSAPSIASGGLKDATPGSDAWSLVSQSQSVVIVGDYNFGPFCDRALLPILHSTMNQIRLFVVKIGLSL